MADEVKRAYHYAPIVADAVLQVHCLTEGCNFRADVGLDGIHGHDPTHAVVLLDAPDYTTHPLYRDSDDRLSTLRRAQGEHHKRNSGAVPELPAQGSA